MAAALLLASPSDAQQPGEKVTSTPQPIDFSAAMRIQYQLPPRPPRPIRRTPVSRTPIDIRGMLESDGDSLLGEVAQIKAEPPKIAAAVVESDLVVEPAVVEAANTETTQIDQTIVSVPSHRRFVPVDIPPPTLHGPMGGQLEQFRYRADEIADSPTHPLLVNPDAASREQLQLDVWWQQSMTTPLGLSDEAMPIDIAELTQTALVSSPYVQAILTEPKIRQNDLVIADAEFDSLAFVEAKFADTNEPVGSDLTTGNNADRFLDQTFSSAGGLRRKIRNGSSLEFVQRGGFQENNSTFLNPNSQGTTRLEINFTQPLLKDHGRAVNNTQVLLARIDLQLANSGVREKLEDHLLDVTRAYWELYAARALWLQRNRLLDGATKLHTILEARGEVDSHQRQILRAQGAVASRRSDLIRAETRIRNAQARLRLLTGDPKLIQATRWELTPQDQPLAFPVAVSTREATLTALDNRPDVAAAIRKIQAVSARVGAARNQVLPRLDMILSTYVAGLDDDSDTLGAFVKQFSEGRPSYAAGLLFEVPLGNRASRARLARNRWELTRTLHEFQQTTELTFTAVEVAVRETHTAFDELLAKKQAIDAADREVDYLQQRWELLPDPNESAILLIENLLDAQQRLADEERAFTQSQVDYAMSWVRLRKAMGVLLRLENPSHSPLVSLPQSEPAPHIGQAPPPESEASER